jgi:hypothetical protein
MYMMYNWLAGSSKYPSFLIKLYVQFFLVYLLFQDISPFVLQEFDDELMVPSYSSKPLS